MPKFEVIIYWSEEDRAFIAEVPELPGCAADGKTYKQALANVEVIIQEWIETAKELGRSIPPPKGRLVFASILNLPPFILHHSEFSIRSVSRCPL
jgi:predicted RNase H-like HicB family nuclease